MGRTESSFDNAAAETFYAVQRGEDHGETSLRADDRPGYEQLLAWARTLGDLSQAGVERTASYGAALSRYLHGEGITVIEVNQPDKGTPQTQRRRLSRDGIRQAKLCPYAIVLACLRWDTCTRGYIDGRVSEGKAYPEALRCLKRYVARDIPGSSPAPPPTSRPLIPRGINTVTIDLASTPSPSSSGQQRDPNEPAQLDWTDSLLPVACRRDTA
ncbi:hypothetical protein [Streptomyces sp. NPDC088748]|uniref:hypothetical protein n=1 Tax=Streptomyces sp. NPDC088748 TaxID=3365887 RepID=UPI003823FE22